MPGFDGTGPAGQGPMTGGARGWCNPGQAVRPAARYLGRPTRVVGTGRPRWGRGLWARGMGQGRAGGRGRGRGFGRW
jgi:hypothetical protein